MVADLCTVPFNMTVFVMGWVSGRTRSTAAATRGTFGSCLILVELGNDDVKLGEKGVGNVWEV